MVALECIARFADSLTFHSLSWFYGTPLLIRFSMAGCVRHSLASFWRETHKLLIYWHLYAELSLGQAIRLGARMPQSARPANITTRSIFPGGEFVRAADRKCSESPGLLKPCYRFIVMNEL